jgi:hypothetical protein
VIFFNPFFDIVFLVKRLRMLLIGRNLATIVLLVQTVSSAFQVKSRSDRLSKESQHLRTQQVKSGNKKILPSKYMFRMDNIGDQQVSGRNLMGAIPEFGRKPFLHCNIQYFQERYGVQEFFCKTWIEDLISPLDDEHEFDVIPLEYLLTVDEQMSVSEECVHLVTMHWEEDGHNEKHMREQLGQLWPKL